MSYSSESKERYWNGYIEAARWSLTHEQDLKVLHQTPFTKPLIELPSWCPNYDCEPEGGAFLECFKSYALPGTTEDFHPYQAGLDLNPISLNTMQEYQLEVSFDA